MIDALKKKSLKEQKDRYFPDMIRRREEPDEAKLAEVREQMLTKFKAQLDQYVAENTTLRQRERKHSLKLIHTTYNSQSRPGK